MKTPVCLLASICALSAFAGREVSLGAYAEETRARVEAKVREALGEGERASVAGAVTYSADGVFFLQRESDGLKIHANGKMPSVGDEVRVDGVPSLEGGHVVFVAREWKRLGAAELPPARAVTSEELVNGEPKDSVNALRVTVEGRTIGVTENGFAMNVGGIPVNVMVESSPDFLSDCDRTHPIVAVTGIAEQMLDQSVLLGREGYVMGVKINVSAPADIVLRPDIAYFAARRDKALVLSVAAFAGVLAIGAIVFIVVIFRQRRRMFRTRTIMAERKRMADDIHDTIEQHLVGAGMLLKLGKVKEAQDILVRAKREIRDVVWGLKNDDMMRLSPADMLRKLAHEENTKGLYRVDTRLEGLPGSLDAAAMRDLSLIVRETIGNAVKHGGAMKIAISSDPLENGGWMLRVSNDGKPFDPEAAPGVAEGHFGLEGMRQRARRLDAEMRIERRGAGMVLILEKPSLRRRLPLPERETGESG